MYTVSKGPSKIVAKTRRGISQNYEKFETIKESSKRTSDLNSPVKNNEPRPVFQPTKKAFTQDQQVEDTVITPQHEEIIKYINDSWNIIVAQNPYDSTTCLTNGNTKPDSNNNTASASLGSSSSTSSISSLASSSACTTPATSPSPTPSPSPLYCVEPPSPVLSDFKPFDLESWWGLRLFNSITKSL